MAIHLYLEGNIGSGKSTFLNRFNEYDTSNTKKIVLEPLEDYQCVTTENGDHIDMLQKLYEYFKKENKDKKDNVLYPFQLLSLICHYDNTFRNKNAIEDVILYERSMFSVKNVFMKLYHDEQHIDDVQWKVYNYIYEQLTQNVHPISGIVYLTTPPNVCMDRLTTRNRTVENSITLEYLSKLHDYHIQMFEHTKIPVLQLDYSMSLDLQCEALKKFITTLKNTQQ